MTKLSIQIPVYNAEEYLELALRSVIAFAPDDAEILIADDGSNDRSPQIAEAIAEQHDSIKFKRFDTNQGCAVVRAWMVEHTDADFIAPFDADDLMLEGYLDKALSKISSDNTIAMVYAKNICFESKQSNITCRGFLGNSFSAFSLAYMCPIPHGSAVIRRGNLLRCGNYMTVPCRSEERIGMADFFLWLRLQSTGKFCFLDECAYMYRIHPTQLGKRSEEQYQRERDAVIAWVENDHPTIKQYIETGDIRLLTNESKPLAMYIAGKRSQQATDLLQQYELYQRAEALYPDDFLLQHKMVQNLTQQKDIRALEYSLNLTQREDLSLDVIKNVLKVHANLLKELGAPYENIVRFASTIEQQDQATKHTAVQLATNTYNRFKT